MRAFPQERIIGLNKIETSTSAYLNSVDELDLTDVLTVLDSIRSLYDGVNIVVLDCDQNILYVVSDDQ